MKPTSRAGGKHVTRWVRLLVPVVALILAVPTAAHAERSVHSDPAGDLVDMGADRLPGGSSRMPPRC